MWTYFSNGNACISRSSQIRCTTLANDFLGGKIMDELIAKVEQWAKDKGLDQAESSKQMLKTVEEVGEVASALARKEKDALRDGIGDVVVTLIILAMQNDMDLYECLNQAYNEIKGRKGVMVDGVFVKLEDLLDDSK